MNRIIFLTACLILNSFAFGQNLLLNGSFESGMLASWMGYNHQVLVDPLTNSFAGNVNNGEGSLYQTLRLTPGETYTVVFDYRWVGGAGDYHMNVRAKDEQSPIVFGSLILDTAPDLWKTGSFSFTVPQENSEVRLVFYKAAGNRPLRIDNVYLASVTSISAPMVDPLTPVNAQPLGIFGPWQLEFSDEFTGTTLDSIKWSVSVSSRSRAPRPGLGVDDWWWVRENVFLDTTGNLALRATKIDGNTMHCGSVESRNLYEPTYGFLEARIKIAETAKGNHTAFWLQGHNMGNVDNSGQDGAEVDIFESAWTGDFTKAVIHFDGYGAAKKNHTIPYQTPGLHNGFHVFGLHWTPDSMHIYYDGVKVQSTNMNKPFPFTVNSSGYPLVPQVPEWLWLSVGASFGDGDFQSQPTGVLSDALVDYVRVYQEPEVVKIEDSIFRKPVRLFPNPASSRVWISSELVRCTVSVFDSQGKLVHRTEGPGDLEIDVSQFRQGMYLFQVQGEDAMSTSHILIR